MTSIPKKERQRSNSVRKATVSGNDTIVAQPSAQSLPNGPPPGSMVAENDGGNQPSKQSPRITDAALDTEPASPPPEVVNPDHAEPTGLAEGSIPPPNTAAVPRTKDWKKEDGKNGYKLDFEGRETLTHQDCMELVASKGVNGQPTCYLSDGTITQISKWQATCKILNFLLTKQDDIGAALATTLQTAETNADTSSANAAAMQKMKLEVNKLEEANVKLPSDSVVSNAPTVKQEGDEPQEDEQTTEETPAAGESEEAVEDVSKPADGSDSETVVAAPQGNSGQPESTEQDITEAVLASPEKEQCDCTDEKNAAYAQGLEAGKNVVTNIPLQPEDAPNESGGTSVAQRVKEMNAQDLRYPSKDPTKPQLNGLKEKYHVSFL